MTRSELHQHSSQPNIATFSQHSSRLQTSASGNPVRHRLPALHPGQRLLVAILASLALHGVWLLRGDHPPRLPQAASLLAITLAPAAIATIVAPTPVPPRRSRTVSSPISRPQRQDTTNLPTPAPMPEALAPSNIPPQPELAPGFATTARAAALQADRAAREQDGQREVKRRPEAHRNLQKLPEESETRLGADFSRRFGEVVVLSVEEKQEGAQRITVVRTNKGMYCGYSRLVDAGPMRDFPMPTMWGDCAK